MNLKIKFLSIFIGLALLAIILPAVASAALTEEQKQSIINVLISFGADQTAINNVRTSLDGGTPILTGTGNIPSACVGINFNRNLELESAGTDVKCLQAILNLSPTTQVQPTGLGSRGYETSFFGYWTLAAVKKYQSANGIMLANRVGPLTRAKLNTFLGFTNPNPNPTTCTSNYQKQCYGNSIYWYNSCGVQQSLYQTCSSTQTCSNGGCITGTNICTESNWSSTVSPTVCPISGTQTKTWRKIGTCSGGVTHSPLTETVTCNYNTPTCTSFSYSSWAPNICPQTGIQTRTINSSSPVGCTGGNPTLSQTCSPQPSIDIKANTSDGPVITFLTLGNGATVNPIGGINLTQNINLTWEGFGLGTCTASDSKNPKIFSGGVPTTSGSQTVTLTGTIPGTSSSDKITDTFTITCITATGATKSDSVTVNLYYTVAGACTPNWQFTWSTCSSGQQTQIWVDLNGCGSLVGKPTAQTQTCAMPCTINNWVATLGPCMPGNYQIKTWEKVGTCEGGVERPPTEGLVCTYVPTPLVDIKAENEDGPLNINLTMGNGATATSTGVRLQKDINLSWAGNDLSSCSSTDPLLSGVLPTAGSQVVTLTGDIQSASSLTFSHTFTINCRTNSGNNVSNSVTVNLTYTINGICTPNWTCTADDNFTGMPCTSGYQTRICTDNNGCLNNSNRPIERRACTLALTTISLSPPLSTMPLGQWVRLTATGADQNGNPITVPTGLTWVSSNPSAVTVDSTGKITVVSSNSGIAEITASYGAIRSNSAIVKPSPTSLTVTPSPASLTVGGSTQFEVKDQNNQPITFGYWTSSNSSVVSINSATGLATANSVGSATISVYAYPVTSSPVNVSVVSGAPTVNISSTRTDPVPGENYTVSWSSTNAGICSVTNGLAELWSCNTISACNAGSNITVRAPYGPGNVTYTIICHGTSSVTKSVTVIQDEWF